MSDGEESEYSECVGLATFSDVVSAFFAKCHLDGVKLPRDNAKLKVNFFNPEK